MSSLQLSPEQVAAFGQYREALETCRRFGNIARFRAKALRDKLKLLGLMRSGERWLDLGAQEFEGFVLTPQLSETGKTGVSPDVAGLMVFGGVSLRDGLVHQADLDDADVPELQVGVLFRPNALLWTAFSDMFDEPFQQLEAEGFEIHHGVVVTGVEDDPDADDLDDAGVADDDEADFDEIEEVDAAADAADAGEDASEDDDDEEDEIAPDFILALRRLPLDRLPERCGPLVTRFFSSALGPLLAMEDEAWEVLLTGRDSSEELSEEE
jgi:hypothetical protein